MGGVIKLNDNAFTLLLGDCRETLKTIPDGTVQCCVTAPPYFGLSDNDDCRQLNMLEILEGSA